MLGVSMMKMEWKEKKIKFLSIRDRNRFLSLIASRVNAMETSSADAKGILKTKTFSRGNFLFQKITKSVEDVQQIFPSIFRVFV